MFGHTSDDQQQTNTAQVDGATDQNAQNTDAQNATTDSSQEYLTDDSAPQTVAPDASMSTSDSTDEATLPEPASAPAAPAAPSANNDELLSIKQQALQQLTPLVGHLDQTPEEKFRTTMMMIQASDNDDLIKEAYAAAQSIPDEKTRAQALLDIVNEINYFTQNQQN
ncbi:MAG TPA: hypothetical protein VJR27_04850 [Candidatus Saccharimonadales bacterium]|nr:hypothetical protein [Candidatus Saccharimonadales bacterium]